MTRPIALAAMLFGCLAAASPPAWAGEYRLLYGSALSGEILPCG